MLRFSRLALFLAVITVVAAAPALHAQYIVPRGNAFIGYSYNHLDFGQGVTRNVNGYEMSVEGQVLPFLGLEGDYSGHYDSRICTSRISCSVRMFRRGLGG